MTETFIYDDEEEEDEEDEYMNKSDKPNDLVCERCGWQWKSRKLGKSKPVSCPRCRSYLWNQKRDEEE